MKIFQKQGNDCNAYLKMMYCQCLRVLRLLLYNLLSLLKQNKQVSFHGFLMLQSGTGKELMLIEDGWKLIIQTNRECTKREPIALFDLNNNPGEMESQNLINSAAHQKRLNDMLEKYNRIRNSKIPTKDLGAPVPR